MSNIHKNLIQKENFVSQVFCNKPSYMMMMMIINQMHKGSENLTLKSFFKKYILQLTEKCIKTNGDTVV